MAEAFATPEQAALAGFAAAAKARVRAAAVHASAPRAVVIVDTDPSHPIEVDCILEDHGWVEGNSGNGWTWAPLDDDNDVGFQTAWNEVPDDVTAVRVEFAGRVADVAVTNGMFLFVDWNVPEREAGIWPHVVGYLRGGKWEDLAVAPEQLRAERMLRAKPPLGWRRLLPRWWGVRRLSFTPPEQPPRP